MHKTKISKFKESVCRNIFLNKIGIMFITCMLIIITVQAAFSTTYYVDFTLGSDSNSGTSTGNAWKRMPGMTGWSGSASLSSGDIVILKGGETWTFTSTTADLITLSVSGITIMGGQRLSTPWGTGYPVLNGATSTTTRKGIYGINKSVTIDGIKIINIGYLANNSAGFGMFLDGGDTIEIMNCWIETKAIDGLAITMGSGNVNHLWIHNNYFKDNGRVEIGQGAGNTPYAISDIKIYNNLYEGPGSVNYGAYHLDGFMIQANNTSDYGIKGLKIYNNKFFGDWSQGGTAPIFLSGCNFSDQATKTCLGNNGPYSTQNVEIFNNVVSFENNSWKGYVSGSYTEVAGPNISPALIDIQAGAHENVKIYNNTISSSATSVAVSNCIYAGVPINGLKVKNNIVSGCDNGITLSSPYITNVDIDYNLYNAKTRHINGWPGYGSVDCRSLASCQASPFYQTNSKTGDPLFKTLPNSSVVGSGDWHLQSGSPATNGGLNLSSPYTTDFDGVYGTARIGAYEYAIETPSTSYALSTSKSGSGTITSSPSGISCGSTCSADYTSGTSVTLTATADSGYTFAGWSGACTGTGSCVVSMTAAKTVSATFTQNATYYTLTASKTGNGTLTTTPSGISCGSTCSSDYESGTSVTVTATADSGYTFTGWSGACSGTGACTIAMTAAKSVAATFTQNATYYTLTATNAAGGTITSNDSAISCGSTCSASYISGASVTLTATANTGYTFSSWSGACTGTGTCTVSMTAAKTVGATFTQNATTYTLTANNSGGGTIASSPAGIDCGATCAYSYTSGTAVTLTATADSGYTFSGWSGACTGTDTCQVTMDTAKTITASFTVTSLPTINVTKKSNNGRVKSTSAKLLSSSVSTNTGIDCGDTCVESYSSGTTVTLEATPDSGYTFSGWSGACSGTGTCTVNVTDATTVEANFTPQASVGNPSSSVGADGGGGGGCFIATAAYGSYLDPQVMVLREFRDKVLINNYFGRLFVKFYYANSPVIAHTIAQNDTLKTVTRLALTPFIYAVTYPSVAVMILLTAVAMIIAVRRKKVHKPAIHPALVRIR